MSFKQSIINSIEENKNAFSSEEFAFYAFTGKTENNVRDKIAFSLHNEITKNNHKDTFVMREWKNKTGTRSDIAIVKIENNTEIPLAIIEIKAKANSKVTDLKEAAALLENDLAKAKVAAKAETEIYLIFICTLYKRNNADLLFMKQYLTKSKELEKTELESEWERQIKNTSFKTPSLLTFLEKGNFRKSTVEYCIFVYGPHLK